MKLNGKLDFWRETKKVSTNNYQHLPSFRPLRWFASHKESEKHAVTERYSAASLIHKLEDQRVYLEENPKFYQVIKNFEVNFVFIGITISSRIAFTLTNNLLKIFQK